MQVTKMICKLKPPEAWRQGYFDGYDNKPKRYHGNADYDDGYKKGVSDDFLESYILFEDDWYLY